MKKYLTIVAALLMLNTASAFAQTTEPTEAKAKCGETVVITATPDAGYEFDYWVDDPTNHNATREVVIEATTADTEFQAVFKMISYTIEVKMKPGQEDWGQVKQSTFTGNKDEVITLEADTTTNLCYKFDHWEDASGTALSTDNPYSYTISGNATVYAVFAEKEFTVKVKSPATGGKVTIAKK